MSGPKTEMLDVSQLTGDTLEVTFVVTVPGVGEKRYPMRQSSLIVGRSDSVDVVVKDASVSSRHCSLTKQGGRVYVRDLGSSNGTFMKDERVSEQELSHGDVLRLGNAATITVHIGNAPVAAPQEMNNEVAGSTMMISAGELDAMRQAQQAPRPAPRRAPPPEPEPVARPRAAPVPTPMPMPVPPSGGEGSKKGLFIGLGVGLGVLVLGVVAVVLFLGSAKRAEDRERIERLANEVSAVNQTTPYTAVQDSVATMATESCTAVQDSVATVAKLSQSVSPPQLPVRARDRRTAEQYIEMQTDTARQYQRIVSNIEQLAAQTQVTIDRVKDDVGRINDPVLQAEAVKVSRLLDERAELTQDFIGGWRKLQREAERRAELVEALWVKGRSGAEAVEYENTRSTVMAPKLLGTCRSSHESKRKEIETQLAELKKLVAE